MGKVIRFPERPEWQKSFPLPPIAEKQCSINEQYGSESFLDWGIILGVLLAGVIIYVGIWIVL